MSTNLAALGYLVAAVCFILALRGMSSPATSRAGKRYGMVGMTVAVAVTLLALPQVSAMTYLLILVGLGIGVGVRDNTGQLIFMTAVTQFLVAFHLLGGLAR